MSKLGTNAIEHALRRAHKNQRANAIPPSQQIPVPVGSYTVFLFFNMQAVAGEGHCILGLGPADGPLMTYSYYRNSAALRAPAIMACLRSPEPFSVIEKASGWIIHGQPENYWNEHMDAAIALFCTKEAYEPIRAYTDKTAAHPGEYDFITNNCLTFCLDALKQGNIRLMNKHGRSLRTFIPRKAFEAANAVEGAKPYEQWKYWFPICPPPHNGLRSIFDDPKRSSSPTGL